MTRIETIFRVLFRAMLACYPAGTRLEFAEEMQAVFDECIKHHKESGMLTLMAFMLRELRDWPIAVVRAYHDEFRMETVRSWKTALIPMRRRSAKREARMSVEDDFQPQGRKMASWISLPPLVLGLGIMIAALVRTDVWYRMPTWQLYLSVSFPLLAGLMVASVGLVALIRRIPDWGITWLGSAFMGFALFAKALLEELIDEGTITLSPFLEGFIGLAFFLTGLALLLVLALRGWHRSGLFTLAAAATMGLSLLQSVTAAPINRDDLALLAGPAGLGFAYLIYLFYTKRGAIRWVAIGVTALVNVGAVVLMAHAWNEWRVSEEALSFIPPLLVLITGLLASGPLSGLIMKPILHRLR
ncbi:MAG: hypothetical protein PVG04_09345 [Anaerolineales bacterium]|jgi:hypothetical protein